MALLFSSTQSTSPTENSRLIVSSPLSLLVVPDADKAGIDVLMLLASEELSLTVISSRHNRKTPALISITGPSEPHINYGAQTAAPALMCFALFRYFCRASPQSFPCLFSSLTPVLFIRPLVPHASQLSASASMFL